MTNQEELNDEETKEVASLGGQILHHWSSGINRQSREIPKSQPTTKLDYEKSYRRFKQFNDFLEEGPPSKAGFSPHNIDNISSVSGSMRALVH